MTSDPTGRNELAIRSLQMQTLQWEFDRSHLYVRASFAAASGASAAKGAGFAARR
jgi:hypothetical protein